MSSLQAALDGATATEAKPPKPATKKKKKPAKEKTVLVGGHFQPDVLKQLRMIAAEEGTTNQALLAEALNLLFVKKGKSSIAL